MGFQSILSVNSSRSEKMVRNNRDLSLAIKECEENAIAAQEEENAATLRVEKPEMSTRQVNQEQVTVDITTAPTEDQQLEMTRGEVHLDEVLVPVSNGSKSEDAQVQMKRTQANTGSSNSVVIEDKVEQKKVCCVFLGREIDSWPSIEVCLQSLMLIIFIILLISLNVWPTITGEEDSEDYDVEEFVDNHDQIKLLADGELLSN